jgi:hypothetical protein
MTEPDSSTRAARERAAIEGRAVQVFAGELKGAVEAMSEDLMLVRSEAVRLLEDCIGFVERLDDATYSAGSRVLTQGTIGKHLRHLVDHYQALLLVDGEVGAAVVDYDHRERDVPMERDRAAAVRAIRGVVESLRRVNVPGNRTVTVRLMVSATGAIVEAPSTFVRELLFASHHATHHCAMMKAIAIENGAGAEACGWLFGTAPSTAHHHDARS